MIATKNILLAFAALALVGQTAAQSAGASARAQASASALGQTWQPNVNCMPAGGSASAQASANAGANARANANAYRATPRICIICKQVYCRRAMNNTCHNKAEK